MTRCTERSEALTFCQLPDGHPGDHRFSAPRSVAEATEQLKAEHHVSVARLELDAAIINARDAAISHEAAQLRFRSALDAYVRLVAPVQAPG